MTGGVLLRLIETFLRRWWLYLLPIVLLTALGVVTVASAPAEYRSSAQLRASTGSLLSDITEIGGSSGFTFETPAQVTARQISELLRTNDFTDRVAADAPVDPVLTGLETRGDLRDAISIYATGENLVTVSATTSDPLTSQMLAQSSIDNFVDWVIDANGIQSDTAEGFLTDLADRYGAELDASAAAIDDYLVANPEPVELGTGRPAAEEIAISRLQSSFDSADQRYRRVLGQLEEVRLGREQTEADTRQRLTIVDAPIVPTEPESGTRRAILSLGLFIIVGVVISMTAIALAALLDRSLRFPGEFRRKLGVDVIASVPRASEKQLKALRSRRLKPPAVGGPPGEHQEDDSPEDDRPEDDSPEDDSPEDREDEGQGDEATTAEGVTDPTELPKPVRRGSKESTNA